MTNKAAQSLGRLGGKAKSTAKAKAARENASKPPRPGSKPRGRPKKARAARRNGRKGGRPRSNPEPRPAK